MPKSPTLKNSLLTWIKYLVSSPVLPHLLHLPLSPVHLPLPTLAELPSSSVPREFGDTWDSMRSCGWAHRKDSLNNWEKCRAICSMLSWRRKDTCSSSISWRRIRNLDRKVSEYYTQIRSTTQHLVRHPMSQWSLVRPRRGSSTHTRSSLPIRNATRYS